MAILQGQPEVLALGHTLFLPHIFRIFYLPSALFFFRICAPSFLFCGAVAAAIWSACAAYWLASARGGSNLCLGLSRRVFAFDVSFPATFRTFFAGGEKKKKKKKKKKKS